MTEHAHPFPFEIVRSPRFQAACPTFTGAAIYAEVTYCDTQPALWEEMEQLAEDIARSYDTTTLKNRSGIAATRQLYRALGKDPSRYRPACEQLARRILQGKGLYKVNALVDLVNYASLLSGYSTAGLDADQLSGKRLILDVGNEGEPYEGIGRGPLNIAGLPVYRDDAGPFATPTSDSTRTQIRPATRRLLMLVNGCDGQQETLDKTIKETLRLLRTYAASQRECTLLY